MERPTERSKPVTPDDAALGAVEYVRYVRKKVEQGLGDAEAGRVHTTDQMQVRFASWLDDRDPN